MIYFYVGVLAVAAGAVALLCAACKVWEGHREDEIEAEKALFGWSPGERSS